MISNGLCGNPIQIAIDGYLATATTIIDEFNLQTGSTTFAEQPQPATIKIRGRAQFPLSSRFLGRRVGIYTQDSTLGFKYIFVGQITSLVNYLVTDDQASFEIDAVSYLNELLNLDGGGNGFPAQNEIDRLNNIFENVTFNEWEDFDTVTTWETLGEFLPTTTWEDFESFYGRNFEWNITGAGEYPLIAYPSQIATGYDLVSDIVSSIRGRIYEVPQAGTTRIGKTVIEYKSRTEMQNDLATTPYVVFDGTKILRDSVAMTADIANMSNNIILSNGTAARSDADYSSIDRFGLRKVFYDSPLSSGSDLQTFATEFLKSSAFTRDLINQVGIVVNETTTTVADAYKIIDCIWQPFVIQMDDLPTGIVGRFGESTQIGIPTGANAQYSNGNLIVQYNLAIRTQILPAQRWLDVTPTATWTTFATPTTQWAELS